MASVISCSILNGHRSITSKFWSWAYDVIETD